MKLLAHLRTSGAWRRIVPWILMSALIATSVVGALVTPWISRAAAPFTVLVFWVVLVPYLAIGPGRRRASAFELTLPLPARRLWLAHVLNVGLGGLALLFLTLAGLALKSWFDGWLDSGFVPGLDGGRLVVLLAAAVALAAVAAAADRPHLHALEDTVEAWGWPKTAALLALPLVLPLLAARPLGWALVLAAAGGALGWRTWRNLPPALDLVPREPQSEPPEGLAATLPPPARPQAAPTAAELRRRVAGILFPWPGVVGRLLALLVLGMAIGARATVTATTVGGREVPLHLVLFTLPWALIVLVAGFYEHLLPRLAFFDPLPIARRRLLALVSWPTLGALVAGYGVGHLAFAAPDLRAAGPALPLCLLFLVPPGLCYLAVAFRLHRATVPERLRYAVRWACTWLLVAAAILQPAIGEPRAVHTWFEGLIRELGRSPAGHLLAWLGLAALAVPAWRLAARRFEGLEAPAAGGSPC